MPERTTTRALQGRSGTAHHRPPRAADHDRWQRPLSWADVPAPPSRDMTLRYVPSPTSCSSSCFRAPPCLVGVGRWSSTCTQGVGSPETAPESSTRRERKSIVRLHGRQHRIPPSYDTGRRIVSGSGRGRQARDPIPQSQSVHLESRRTPSDPHGRVRRWPPRRVRRCNGRNFRTARPRWHPRTRRLVRHRHR